MPKLPEALGTPQDLGAVPPDPSRLIPHYQAGQAIAQAGGPASYGPGFWQAFDRVTAADGDPSKIRDFATLLKLAGPEGGGR